MEDYNMTVDEALI